MYCQKLPTILSFIFSPCWANANPVDWVSPGNSCNMNLNRTYNKTFYNFSLNFFICIFFFYRELNSQVCKMFVNVISTHKNCYLYNQLWHNKNNLWYPDLQQFILLILSERIRCFKAILTFKAPIQCLSIYFNIWICNSSKYFMHLSQDAERKATQPTRKWITGRWFDKRSANHNQSWPIRSDSGSSYWALMHIAALWWTVRHHRASVLIKLSTKQLRVEWNHLFRREKPSVLSHLWMWKWKSSFNKAADSTIISVAAAAVASAAFWISSLFAAAFPWQRVVASPFRYYGKETDWLSGNASAWRLARWMCRHLTTEAALAAVAALFTGV